MKMQQYNEGANKRSHRLPTHCFLLLLATVWCAASYPQGGKGALSSSLHRARHPHTAAQAPLNTKESFIPSPPFSEKNLLLNPTGYAAKAQKDTHGFLQKCSNISVSNRSLAPPPQAVIRKHGFNISKQTQQNPPMLP